MILLDTNICMTIINAKPAAVVERFGAQPPGPGDVSGPTHDSPF
jgi:predicted nucleic acid-binding protein